jgi:hypothetical protein
MNQPTTWPRVLTLLLAILSACMLVVASIGDSGSPLYVNGFDQFPLSLICFAGCVVAGTIVAVLSCGFVRGNALMRTPARVAAQSLIALSAIVTWYAIAGVAISYGINDLVLRCYPSADGTCDGPAPFDWTPYLIAGASLVLFLGCVAIYQVFAARARISVGDRVRAVSQTALSTVPLLNIVAAYWLLRPRPGTASGLTPKGEQLP